MFHYIIIINSWTGIINIFSIVNITERAPRKNITIGQHFSCVEITHMDFLFSLFNILSMREILKQIYAVLIYPQFSRYPEWNIQETHQIPVFALQLGDRNLSDYKRNYFSSLRWWNTDWMISLCFHLYISILCLKKIEKERAEIGAEMILLLDSKFLAQSCIPHLSRD